MSQAPQRPAIPGLDLSDKAKIGVKGKIGYVKDAILNMQDVAGQSNQLDNAMTQARALAQQADEAAEAGNTDQAETLIRDAKNQLLNGIGAAETDGVLSKTEVTRIKGMLTGV